MEPPPGEFMNQPALFKNRYWPAAVNLLLSAAVVGVAIIAQITAPETRSSVHINKDRHAPVTDVVRAIERNPDSSTFVSKEVQFRHGISGDQCVDFNIVTVPPVWAPANSFYDDTDVWRSFPNHATPRPVYFAYLVGGTQPLR